MLPKSWNSFLDKIRAAFTSLTSSIHRPRLGQTLFDFYRLFLCIFKSPIHCIHSFPFCFYLFAAPLFHHPLQKTSHSKSHVCNTFSSPDRQPRFGAIDWIWYFCLMSVFRCKKAQIRANPYLCEPLCEPHVCLQDFQAPAHPVSHVEELVR